MSYGSSIRGGAFLSYRSPLVVLESAICLGQGLITDISRPILCSFSPRGKLAADQKMRRTDADLELTRSIE